MLRTSSFIGIVVVLAGCGQDKLPAEQSSAESLTATSELGGYTAVSTLDPVTGDIEAVLRETGTDEARARLRWSEQSQSARWSVAGGSDLDVDGDVSRLPLEHVNHLLHSIWQNQLAHDTGARTAPTADDEVPFNGCNTYPTTSCCWMERPIGCCKYHFAEYCCDNSGHCVGIEFDYELNNCLCS